MIPVRDNGGVREEKVTCDRCGKVWWEVWGQFAGFCLECHDKNQADAEAELLARMKEDPIDALGAAMYEALSDLRAMNSRSGFVIP